MLLKRFAIVFILIIGSVLMFKPSWLLNRLSAHTPEVLYSVQTQEPILALTIDDGPDPSTTPRILDLLLDYDARATFFLLSDRIPGNEALVQRIVDEGHEIGNHLTDDQPSIRLSADEFEGRLLHAQETLSQFGEVRWFRPGSGWYNKFMRSVLIQHGYRLALGSIHPFDSHIPSSWFASNYILWRAQPGAIIVLHDNGDRGGRTADTLEKVLPALIARDFRFVTLTELIEQAQGKD
ncbi:MAG: chitin deacetylase family protein [Anaerolineales bacterium]|nr:chitin deacetylase family protein [Anaerolineales bacterium]